MFTVEVPSVNVPAPTHPEELVVKSRLPIASAAVVPEPSFALYTPRPRPRQRPRPRPRPRLPFVFLLPFGLPGPLFVGEFDGRFFLLRELIIIFLINSFQ